MNLFQETQLTFLGLDPAADDDPHRRSLEALDQLARSGSSELPSREDVGKLLGRVRNRVAQIMSRCAAVDVFVAAQLDFSSTTDDVEAVYADLQLYHRWLDRLDDPAARPPATEGYFEYLHFAVRRLIDAEQLLAHQLHQWLLQLRARQGTDSALRLFLTQVSAWHAYVKRGLEDGKNKVEERLDSEFAALRGDPLDAFDSAPREIHQRADELIRAGELELMEAFANLVRIDAQRLSTFLREDRLYAKRRDFVLRLWSVADLVLAETPSDPADGPVCRALRSDPEVGPRFELLAELLAEDAPAVDAHALRERFEKIDARSNDRDLEMIWRALVIAHPDQQVRERAAAHAPLDALWLVLAYPHSSVPSMYAVAEQVAERGDDDLRKVLYDCVKSRLLTAMAETESADELRQASRFIRLFFGFAFFIQTRYFEQLETLLHLFRAQARRFGTALGDLDRHFHDLEIARHRAGQPEATTPGAIDRLPLPLQRHLAREGSYLLFFACHPNNLISREVVSYLHADNLGRFIELPELNRQMLEEALRRIDLGGRRELVISVLSHPKCPMLFASRHLPQLTVSELHRVVQSRTTQSEVKRKAMLVMIKKKGRDETRDPRF